jgi:hypothetical protein
VTYIPGGDPFSIVKASVVPTKMFFVVAEIGGDQARDLLLHNRVPEVDKDGTNRKPSAVTVKKYKLLMLSGQWDENPQPIVLSETVDGFEVSDLNDGQQRLMALVEASVEQPNIRVRFTFAFDAPIDSKWVLDQGKRRLPGDFLQMAGEKHANSLSHAVRMLYAVEKLRPFQSIGIWRKAELTPRAYTQFLKAHIELKQGLDEALKLKMESRSLVMPHVGAVLWFMMQQEYGLWKTTEFFNGLATGAQMDTDDPRKVTREFLAIQWRSKYKWDGFEQLAVLIACANAFLLGIPFVPKHAFNKLAQKQKWPELIKASQLPETMLVPGNMPAP